MFFTYERHRALHKSFLLSLGVFLKILMDVIPLFADIIDYKNNRMQTNVSLLIYESNTNLIT